MLDHTVAFATFPNLGKAVASHAILDVRTGNGGDVWSGASIAMGRSRARRFRRRSPSTWSS